MEQLKAGDDLALDALMERWERALIAFISRYTDHSDAVDLAQGTFVRIYEHRRRYRLKGKFSTWMFAIALNLCRNHARWVSRHPTVPISSGDNVESPADPPDKGAQRSDEAAIVRRAVRELPDDLRAAVVLFEFEGLSHAQIAEVQKCSIKAVETRLYRARKALRVRLSKLL